MYQVYSSLGRRCVWFEYSILNILSLDFGLFLIVAWSESVDPETGNGYIVCIRRR